MHYNNIGNLLNTIKHSKILWNDGLFNVVLKHTCLVIIKSDYQRISIFKTCIKNLSI